MMWVLLILFLWLSIRMLFPGHFFFILMREEIIRINFMQAYLLGEANCIGFLPTER